MLGSKYLIFPAPSVCLFFSYFVLSGLPLGLIKCDVAHAFFYAVRFLQQSQLVHLKAL